MRTRTVFICAMLLVFSALVIWAQDVNVTGTWTGTITGPQGDFSLTYTFKQEGAKLTGTVTGPTDPLPIVDGKVEGDKISFSLNVDMGGGNVKFSSKGTIKGDEIKLSTTNDAGMEMGGEMTLKKQK